MRNEQYGPQHAAEALASVVRGVAYKDDWTISLHMTKRILIACETCRAWAEYDRMKDGE